MAFYLVTLSKETCAICGKKATHRVYRSGTDARGFYCERCGKKQCERLNKLAEEGKADA